MDVLSNVRQCTCMYMYATNPVEHCTGVYANHLCHYFSACCGVCGLLQEIIVLAETAKNETLLCPLCKGVFRDPHIATCGVRPSN